LENDLNTDPSFYQHNNNNNNNQLQLPSPTPGARYGGFSSYEEAFQALGLLDDKPPQEVGQLGHPFYTVQPFQLLSWRPRAYLFPNFIDPVKCDHIVDLATRRLEPSSLALKKGETEENTQNIRTSQGTFLSRSDDPDGILAWVEDKIAVVSGVPSGHGEAFNFLRYQPNQHYDSHFDYFDPEDGYERSQSQRIATVLMYLSDVEEGGETVFQLEGRDGLKRLRTIDYKACDTGIKIKPRKGDALLFWSMDPDGKTLDKHALHGGCPVVSGTKHVMTKWIRNVCSGPSCIPAKQH